MPKDDATLSAASAGSTPVGLTPYYQRDGITIYHGDCLELLHDIGNIGAVVTDPPYSSGGAFRGDRARSTTSKYVQTGTLAYRPEFSNDHLDQRSYMMWTEAWLRLAKKSAADGAVLLAFTDWRQLPALTDCIQFSGWTWRNMATWWKPGIRMQKGRFSSSAEYIVYGSNGPLPHGAESPQNVFSSKVESDKVHIAEKPLAVMRWCLGVVPLGAKVLDPFMGSGTTLVAARDMGLQAIGIEVDERYCEAAAKRLGQGGLF